MLKTKQKLIESALAELKKEDDVLLEMANIIREEHPEIPANIFISSGRGYPHGPRIKVQTDHDASVQDSMMVPIIISDRNLDNN